VNTRAGRAPTAHFIVEALLRAGALEQSLVVEVDGAVEHHPALAAAG